MAEKPISIKLSERDDLADLLGLIPQWVIGAVFWVLISEFALKRLFPNDFYKLQGAIVGADYVASMPPGVAMVAVMYVTLEAAEVSGSLLGNLGKILKAASEDPETGDLVKLITFQWGAFL